MEPMERLEELKRAMMAKTFYREGMPEKVMGVVQEALDGLMNRYRELHCDNLSIQEYIQGNLEYVKSFIMKNLGEKRKDNQIEQVQHIVRRMERELENLDEPKEDKRRNQEGKKDEIDQIEPGDKNTTVRIMEVLEDSLRDVQSAQNRILDANGFSMDRIYEGYLLQNRKDEEEKEETAKKSRREEFVEGLDSGISLEEQRDFSIEQANQKEKRLEQKQEEPGKQVQVLPDNVIE